LTTEAYLADEDKAGKRKASQEQAENTSLDEEDKDEEAGKEAGEKMPAAAKTKKTPKAMPKTPPKPPTTAPTAKGDEDDVDGLADDVQANLNLNAWYKIDHSQEFAIVACIFPDPKMQTRYVYIRVKLTGSIESSQVKARLIKDGDATKSTVNFQKGGKLTNPKHCLVQFQDVLDFDVNHPLYLAMAQIHRFHGKSKEESETILIVNLPFRCDTQGFYDPINEEQNDLNLGIFPLPNAQERAHNAPPPSTRFLHVMCEELVKAKLKQKTKTRSYFTPPRPTPQGPNEDNHEVSS
jgi:hypothetical protein